MSGCSRSSTSCPSTVPPPRGAAPTTPVRRASWRRIGVSCLALGAALVPAAALAQTAPASQDPEATEIDEVVVTGIRGSLRSAQSIKESGLPLQLAGEPFSEIRNALPFRKDEAGTALRDKVDAALTELKADGTLAEISRKWFDTDITTPAAQAAAQ